MCMIAAGLMLVSAISGAIYYFNKIELNDKDEDLGDKSVILKEENVIPIKPPRKLRKYPKLDENEEFFSSQSSRERCNTRDSANDQINRKILVTVQLEKIPNKTTSNSEEKLNSSKSLIPKNDVNFVDNELKHSSIILLENINDYAEKSVIRKTSNVKNKEVLNETDTTYFSLPENLGFCKDPLLTSTKSNISHESKEFDNEITMIKKVSYSINKENLNDDVSRTVTIEINKSSSRNCYENNNNANSSLRSNSYHTKNENLETRSIKRQKKLSKLLLCYSK